MLGIGRWRKEGGGGGRGGGGAKSGWGGRLSPAAAGDDGDGDTEATTGLDETRDRLAAAEDTFQRKEQLGKFQWCTAMRGIHGATGYLLYVRYFFPHPQHTVNHLLTVLQSGIVYHV